MDLTPRHIQQKQFHDAFRGYSHEEVDLFLDEVSEAFDQVFRENQTFHHRLRQLEEQLTEAKGSEDMLKRMLLTAQKTAEDAVEEARGKAQGMIVAAERKAQEVVANAERRAQEIVSEATTAERELQVGVEGLKRFDAEYRARLQAFIESQLRVLAEGPVATKPAPAPAPAMEAPKPAPAPAAEPPKAAPRPAEPPKPEPAPVAEHSQQAVVPQPPQPPQPSPSVPPSTAPAPSPVSAPAPAPPGRPSVGTAPSARPQTPADSEDEEERSIKELFWGDE